MPTMTDAVRIYHIAEGVGKGTYLAREIVRRLISQANLSLSEAHVWEGDDSLEAYDTIHSLVDYVNEYGGVVVRLDPNQQVTVMDGKNASSGKFCIIR